MPAGCVSRLAAVVMAFAAAVVPARAADEPASSVVVLKAELFEKAALQRSIATMHKLFAAGRFGEALPLAEEAFEAAQKVHGPNHHVVSASAYNLGVLYRRLGRESSAI